MCVPLEKPINVCWQDPPELLDIIFKSFKPLHLILKAQSSKLKLKTLSFRAKLRGGNIRKQQCDI